MFCLLPIFAISFSITIPVAFTTCSQLVVDKNIEKMGHVVTSILFFFLLSFLGLFQVITASESQPWYESLPAVAMGKLEIPRK